MKKVLIILLFIAMCGCNKENNNTKNVDDLSIVSPSGAPSLAFYNEINNPNFNTGDVSSILPELQGENGSEIIIVDTVNGIKALNNKANYLLAATITFGNFYIASTGNDDNDLMDDGDYIVLFSQGATPDLIFHYLYGSSFDSNIHYVNAVADASACLIKGINISDDKRKVDEEPYVDYVMIAEPALSASLAKNDRASIYANVQELYKNKNNNLKLIQASVFVSKKLDSSLVNEYLNNLEISINYLLSNPQIFIDKTEDMADEEIKDIFGVPNSKLAYNVLTSNSIGLGFSRSYNIKKDIDAYLSIFGIDSTNEEIYFK